MLKVRCVVLESVGERQSIKCQRSSVKARLNGKALGPDISILDIYEKF